MKRQDRLALFFERERQAVEEKLNTLSGLAGVYFSGASPLVFQSPKLAHFFTAATQLLPDINLVFNEHEWPLPADFFEVVILSHPLEYGFELQAVLQEALRVLRKDGTLIITGFNRIRLCSRPIQKTLAKQSACAFKSYSSLKLLSALDEAGFVTKLSHFDFCRFPFLNELLSRCLPFLGIGFLLTAKRQLIDLKPLDEMNWNFDASKILNPAIEPEFVNKKKQHE